MIISIFLTTVSSGSPDILPETPSDSSSEQCLSSPTYMMNSPSDHSAVLQYPDNPALYQGKLDNNISPITPSSH